MTTSSESEVKRLRHSAGAFARSSQMRRARLQIYTEGKFPDVYVYEKIARSVCRSSWDYVLITPQELPPEYAGDGKSALRKWYESMRRRALLRINFKGRHAVSVFIFDKDIDDVRRTKCRSPHVIYTECYDIEGHVFSGGNLVDSVSALLDVSSAKVASAIPDQAAWLNSVTERWREWVRISVAAAILRAHKYSGYRVPSRVHTNHSGLADQALLAQEMDLLRKALPPPDSAHDDLLKRVERLVDRRYRSGIAFTLFKGKWFATVLESDLREAGLLSGKVKGSFGRNIVTNMMIPLEPSGQWANFARVPILNLLSLIPNSSISSVNARN
ncbi:hypothetical protein [Micromonospora sp. NPDC048898]|uniref:hypothetical protein n=1 Tax=Micromonospora sp. NPDC048898 TaxID=3364260 RepID=UPI00371A15FC